MPAKSRGFLHRDDVQRAFHDDDGAGITARIGAESAGVAFAERSANLASRDGLANGLQGISQTFEAFSGTNRKVERESFRTPPTNAGEL